MHGTEEASNDGRVRVRIIHGLNISQKNSYTYCKDLEAIKKFKYYAHAPRGIDWQEKTIARPRPPLIRKTIKEHLMFQICYITFTIRACYGTCKLQHKYFSNSQLLNQHKFNITTPYLKTIIKHQTFLSIQHTHKKVLLLILHTKHIRILRKLPCY